MVSPVGPSPIFRVSSLPNKLDQSPLYRRQLDERGRNRFALPLVPERQRAFTEWQENDEPHPETARSGRSSVDKATAESIVNNKIKEVVQKTFGFFVEDSHPLVKKLEKHFSRLSNTTRYALDVDTEDILLHMDLFREAEMNSSGIAVRIVPNVPYQLGSAHRTDISSCNRKIVTVFRDRRNRLKAITTALSSNSINIQEAFAVCSIDGFALDTFVVDGDFSDSEIQRTLHSALKEAGNTPPPRNNSSRPGHDLGKDRLFLGKSWEIDSAEVTVTKKISEGGSGEMYVGLWCGTRVAVKKLKVNEFGSNKKVQQEFQQEVEMLSQLRHPNIVLFIGACTSSPHLWIITEFLAGGSLYQLLHSGKLSSKLELPHLLQLAKEIACGMNYLHKSKIIHRDLKSPNLVLDDHGHVKIVDFGLSRIKEENGDMTGETGSYRWAAPEILRNERYSEKVDVYSFGIVLWEMVTGEVPYAKYTPIQAALAVAEKGLRLQLPRSSPRLPQQLCDLIEDCWADPPECRPSFDAIMPRLDQIQVPKPEALKKTSSWFSKKLSVLSSGT